MPGAMTLESAMEEILFTLDSASEEFEIMESVRNLYRLVANKEISEEEALDAINKRCGANSEKVNELFNDLKVLGEAIGAIKETIRNAQQQSIVLKDSRMLKVVVGAFYRVVDRLIDQNKMTYLEM